MLQMVQTYLNELKPKVSPGKSIEQVGQLELELKFGKKKGYSISKAQYCQVVKTLLNEGWTRQSETEYIHLSEPLSGVRARIEGEDNLKELIQFTRKVHELPATFEKKTRLSIVDLRDKFNLTTTLSREMKQMKFDYASANHGRYISRWSLIHPTKPYLQADFSMIRECPLVGDWIHDLFSTERKFTYEIEIEIQNDAITASTTVEEVMTSLNGVVELVIGGLQSSGTPELYDMLDEAKRHLTTLTKTPKFIGFDSDSLSEMNGDLLRNAKADYVVTDKADGERKLLYIDVLGRLYYFNKMRQLQPTGWLVPANCGLANTLLDGEYLLEEQGWWHSHHYAAFDIYYLGGEDVRGYPLLTRTTSEAGIKYDECRYTMVQFVVAKLSQMVNPKAFSVKKFHPVQSAKKILRQINVEQQNELGYHIDGLIFMPAFLPLPKLEMKEVPRVWHASLKWKDNLHSTADFQIHLLNDATNANGANGAMAELYMQEEGKRILFTTTVLPLDMRTLGDRKYFTHGSIVEFMYKEADQQWHPFRLREDKDSPNTVKNVKSVQEAIQHPFMLETLE